MCPPPKSLRCNRDRTYGLFPNARARARRAPCFNTHLRASSGPYYPPHPVMCSRPCPGQALSESALSQAPLQAALASSLVRPPNDRLLPWEGPPGPQVLVWATSLPHRDGLRHRSDFGMAPGPGNCHRPHVITNQANFRLPSRRSIRPGVPQCCRANR